VLEVTSFWSSGGEEYRLLPDGSVLVEGTVPGTSTYTVHARTRLRGVTAFRVETLTDPSLPGTGPGRADDKRPNFELTELRVERRRPGRRGVPIQLHTPFADFGKRGHGVRLAIDDDGTTGWSIGGAFGKPHWAVFLTREPVGDEPDEVTELAFSLEQNGGFGQTIGRLRLSASTEDPERLALGPFGIQLLRTTPRTAQVEAGLERFFRRWNLARRELAWLEEMLAGKKLATTPVIEELAAPRETFILTRGDHLQPGARVGPATPKSLHAWDEALPRNRLGLAKWLVDPSNPLVARATVNRWWAQLFGRGLVPTPEDFGTQGERPSHPDLLDWLAVELVSSGWGDGPFAVET
jgi:hypothetical protein